MYTDEYSVLSNQKDETEVYYEDGVIGFSSSDYVSFKNDVGNFSCKSYFVADEYSFVVENCQPEKSRFEVLIELPNRTIKIPATFSSQGNITHLKNNGGFAGSGIYIKALTSIYLGKIGKIFKKEVNLDPGNYSIDSEYGVIDIFNEKVGYRFLKDGSLIKNK